jgi:DNA polymerase elongation subunit (family B)
MYQNIYINRKDWVVSLWDDEKGLVQFPYPKYAYKRQVGGKYKSIYGDDLTKVTNFHEKDTNLFESDVPPETRVLMDMYQDSDEPSQGHKIGIVDIEVDTTGGYANNAIADKEITAISLFDQPTKTCYVYILDREGKIQDQERDGGLWAPLKDYKATEEDRVKLVIRSFDDEDNMLMAFMDKWQECGFTIITGWNIAGFDLPYLYVRLKNCLGAKVAKFLSPIGTAYMNGHTGTLKIAGVAVLDYIDLYKKSVVKMEPSYTLNAIGLKIAGVGKVAYQGNLNDLYKSDIEKFVEYNITDVKVVALIDKKVKFIDLVRNICHVGHVPLDCFHLSSRYLEGAILMYLRRNGGRIAPNKPAQGREEYEERLEEGEEGFSGAYVKPPVPGKYEWVFDLDLTSMYPNILISLNASPETKVGKVTECVLDDYASKLKRIRLLADNKEADEPIEDSDKLEAWIDKKLAEFDMDLHVRGKIQSYKVGPAAYSIEEFKGLVTQSNYSLSSNGILYRTDKKGVIPEILTVWFNQRQTMRKKAAEFRKAGNMAQYEFFNARQQVWKILLNSLYGVLGLPIFRFYDVDNAEAVTTTGVSIIKTTAMAINNYYKQELQQDGDWVIYSDTDSCFVAAIPMIKKRFPNIDMTNDDEMTKAIMTVTTDVQWYVNNFYNVMAKRFFNVDKHTFDAKQEVISKTSFWLAKKRYAQWIIHKEGSLLKEPELEVKGIDVVRTSFPAAFRKFMEMFLRKILTGSEREELDDMILKFREEVKTLGVIEIAKNTSVKYVSQDGKHNYCPEDRKPFSIVKGTPAQVKAAIAYNDLIDSWGLNKTTEHIHHGQKIKWVYLKDNEYMVEALAMKADGNDPPEIVNFINSNVDRSALFEKELKSKLMDFYNVYDWQFPNSSMKVAAQFFEF